MRRAEKRIDTFGAGLSDMVVLATGRLHGDYFVPTKTGRLSRAGHPIYNSFRPMPGALSRRRDGRVLLAADFSQIELRILS